MTGVFINYRRGDGNETAAHLHTAIRERFGKDISVFYASSSMTPGTAFPQALLDGVRDSTVLLALIGPGWLSPRLQNPEDWVRREIEEAFNCGVQVIPVLLGRCTERLSRQDLPDSLALLADLQFLRFDVQDKDAGLQRICDLLVERIPELQARAQAEEAAAAASSDSVSNTVGGTSSSVVQGRDFNGVVVNNVQGSQHTGSGTLNHNPRHVSGDRHFTSTNMTYLEGDNHGNAGNHHHASCSDGSEGR